MTRILRITTFALVLALVMSGCSVNSSKATEELMPTAPPAVEANDVSNKGNGETDSVLGTQNQSDEENEVIEKTIVIETSNFSYAPNIINANPGDTIIVKLVNAQGTHDFLIDELNVHTDHVENPGDTHEVTFTIPVDAAGKSYEFYCGVANHRALGQVGTLQISQ